MQAIKHDSGKPRVDLVDPKWLLDLARVLGYGAEKYSAHNWRSGLNWSRLYAAAQRHLLAFQSGELNDPESGQSHLLHAACNLMMLYSVLDKSELNDFYWSDTNRQFKDSKEDFNQMVTPEAGLKDRPRFDSKVALNPKATPESGTKERPRFNSKEVLNTEATPEAGPEVG